MCAAIDPDNRDPHDAMHRALEIKIPHGRLTEPHWISYLRDVHQREKRIPTVYETCETCETCGLDLEELEALFPDGYRRGAVKIAGLRFVK